MSGPVSSQNYSSGGWTASTNAAVAAGVFVGGLLLLILLGALGGHLDASLTAK